MELNRTFRLANGVEMPVLSLAAFRPEGGGQRAIFTGDEAGTPLH